MSIYISELGYGLSRPNEVSRKGSLDGQRQKSISTKDEARPQPGIVPNYRFAISGVHRGAQASEGMADDNYKEHVAQSSNRKNKTPEYTLSAPEGVRKSLLSCSDYAITGVCEGEHSHKYGLLLNCRKPYCQICGVPDSDTHKQRVAKWLKKGFKIADMQYWVIQWPTEERDKLKTKHELNRVRKAIYRWFIRHGWERGLAAWHTHGDPKCPNGCAVGKNAKHTKPRTDDGVHYHCPQCGEDFDVWESVASWNPHLNLLVDGGFIPKEQLEQLIEELRKLAGCKLIINMQYIESGDIKKKIHKIKYITRPTFRNYKWNPEMVEELQGFRYVSHWGSTEKWQGEDEWTIEGDGDTGDLLKLEENKCIDCGSHIHWDSHVYTIEELKDGYAALELAGGYFALTPLNRYKDRERDRYVQFKVVVPM